MVGIFAKKYSRILNIREMLSQTGKDILFINLLGTNYLNRFNG